MRETPPDTPRRPVTEELHGEELTDPYRWLEEDTEEVREWIDAQNEYTDYVLDSPTRDALGPTFEDVARVTEYGAVTAAGGLYFQTIQAPDEDHPVLYVRASFEEEAVELVDPNRFDGEAASMNWFTVAPDGDRVAYGYDEGGEEQYDVRVVDVDTGTWLDVVPDAGRVNPGGFAWTDNGFYSVRTGGPAEGEMDEAGEGDQLDKALYYHEHGDDPAEDELITDDFSEHDWPVLEIDDETGTLFAAIHEGTTHSEIYRVDEQRSSASQTQSDGVDPDADEPLVPLLTGYDATFGPHVGDGEVHLLTNYEADFSRVLTADIETLATGENLDPDDFTETIPETEAVLQDIAVAGDALVANHLRDASSELSVWEDGSKTETLPAPEFCTIDGTDADDDGEELFYVVHDFEEPDRVTRYPLVGGGGPEVLGQADVELGVDVEVSQEFFESADGTDVPAFVVHREGLEPEGEAPTVLYGYGGFRIPQTPSYWRFAGPFLAAGGVFAVANLRGGTEYGEPWHEAGMGSNKQNVFDDFHAVGEGLIEAGYTDSDHLGAYGGSNGGLLTGAALTQRPDLWDAVLCTVPLLDMLRFHRFLLGESWTVEYGSPDDPEDFEYIREYSPYHNVEDREYPATMFKTAAGDTRVHPSHARKMTARLQYHQAGDEPIALRTETDTGHGIGKSTEMIVEEQVDQWTWLCDQLGAELEAKTEADGER